MGRGVEAALGWVGLKGEAALKRVGLMGEAALERVGLMGEAALERVGLKEEAALARVGLWRDRGASIEVGLVSAANLTRSASEGHCVSVLETPVCAAETHTEAGDMGLIEL